MIKLDDSNPDKKTGTLGRQWSDAMNKVFKNAAEALFEASTRVPSS